MTPKPSPSSSPTEIMVPRALAERSRRLVVALRNYVRDHNLPDGHPLLLALADEVYNEDEGRDTPGTVSGPGATSKTASPGITAALGKDGPATSPPTDWMEEARAKRSELKTLVDQFNEMKLPGQPFGMHMGTSYLVNDLWRALDALLSDPLPTGGDDVAQIAAWLRRQSHTRWTSVARDEIADAIERGQYKTEPPVPRGDE